MNEHVQTDINSASYLLQRGFRLREIRHVSGSRYGFVFDDPRGEASIAAAEFLADAPAPARSLLNCFRTLKAQLFSIRNKYEYENSNIRPR
jgi:hypothetical protein